MAEMALHCQYGDHTWTRPAQRGRPPLHCPEHMAAGKAAAAPVKAPARDYASMTLPAIRAALKEHGVTGVGKKDELLKTLKVRDRLAQAKITRAANKAAARKAVAATAQKAAGSRSKAHAATPTQKGVAPTRQAARPVVSRSPRSRAARTTAKPDIEGVTAPKTELEVFIDARDAADKIRRDREQRAKERIDNLELMLKAQGTHISQNQKVE